MTVKHGNATDLGLDPRSVHCVVTSPPYNVGVEYGTYIDSIPWPEYETMAQLSACEMHYALVDGGRAWINVMPAVPQTPHDHRVDLQGLWFAAMRRAGFKYRDTVIWNQDSHDGACAWGSWLSPSAPNLRGGYEVVLCFFKGRWKRPPSKAATDTGQQPRVALGGDWTDLARNVWTLRPARRRDGAPAPFPPELPARCIRLSTWPGETVLDPFAGSGTTIEVAEQLGRVGLGFDIGAKP